MPTVPFPDDVSIAGDLRVNGSITPKKDPSDILAQQALQPFTIPMTAWRVWDAMQTNLPGTPLTDDLGIVGGTFATGSPSLQTEDLKAAGATNSYARAQVIVPMEYDTGQSIVLRCHAGMLTTISDGTATLDVQCYKSDEEAGISADLCATAATTINSVTLADVDFTITATAISPGDVLDIRLHTAINDAATGTVVKGIIGAVQLLCDVVG